jgi:hypothetical protein
VSALNLADGPAMYLGGSIMTFALPYGAFIVIASVLFFLYRRPHSGPKLKYLTSPPVTSVLTREPGPAPAAAAASPAPTAAAAAAASPAPAAAATATESPADVPAGESPQASASDPGAPEGKE